MKKMIFIPKLRRSTKTKTTKDCGTNERGTPSDTRNAIFVEKNQPTSQLSIVNQLLVVGLSRFNIFTFSVDFHLTNNFKSNLRSFFSRKKLRYNELPTWTGKLTHAKYDVHTICQMIHAPINIFQMYDGISDRRQAPVGISSGIVAGCVIIYTLYSSTTSHVRSSLSSTSFGS